jgi:hypothetical protein
VLRHLSALFVVVVVVVVVVAAVAAVHGHRSPASPTRKPPAHVHEVPSLARLDPALHAALRQAGREAAGDGVELVVDSGWRSPAHQARLLREAIATYGSAPEARRWVATPNTSAHVSGDAVDIGRSGAAWLSARGAAYGLCQIYANEPWDFELRPDAVDDGCPPTYADPTHDPRMQQ